MNYFLGVDLGSQQDYSAVVLLHRAERVTESQALPGTWQAVSERKEVYSVYEVPLIERYQLGVEYGDVITRVRRVLDLPALFRQQVGLVVDATGVGLPVLQQMRADGLNPIGVTITGGSSVAENEAGYTVPKRDLVSAMQVLFQSRRIKISPKLELAPVLRDELKAFRGDPVAKKSADNPLEARSGKHDDVVLACAIAVWFAERSYGYRVPQPLDASDVYNPLRIMRD